MKYREPGAGSRGKSDGETSPRHRRLDRVRREFVGWERGNIWREAVEGLPAPDCEDAAP